MNPAAFQRYIVVGATSSGKSTLAKQLAHKIGGDYIELDALNWGPNWTPAGDELLRDRAENATRSPCWVVAGNYRVTRPVTWPRAEAVIWLDYSLPVVLWRLLTRTIRRGITQEELWNGNREKFWWHLKLWSDESLFHWLFKTYWRRKQEYPELFALPEYSHLHIFRFKRTIDAQIWLERQ